MFTVAVSLTPNPLLKEAGDQVSHCVVVACHQPCFNSRLELLWETQRPLPLLLSLGTHCCRLLHSSGLSLARVSPSSRGCLLKPCTALFPGVTWPCLQLIFRLNRRLARSTKTCTLCELHWCVGREHSFWQLSGGAGNMTIARTNLPDQILFQHNFSAGIPFFGFSRNQLHHL